MSNEIAKVAVLTRTETTPLTPTLALNRELYLNSTCTTLYCKDTGGVVRTLTGGSGGGSVTQGDINDAITTHSNEVNPHSNYQLKSEKNSANGYVGLSVNKRIIFDSRSDGVNDTTSFFINDNTASRTYTFPNKTGTVALLSDINDTNINPLDYQIKSEKNEASGYVGIAADRRIPIRNITDTFTSYVRNNDDASYVYTLPSKTGVLAIENNMVFFQAGLSVDKATQAQSAPNIIGFDGYVVIGNCDPKNFINTDIIPTAGFYDISYNIWVDFGAQQGYLDAVGGIIITDSNDTNIQTVTTICRFNNHSGGDNCTLSGNKIIYLDGTQKVKIWCKSDLNTNTNVIANSYLTWVKGIKLSD